MFEQFPYADMQQLNLDWIIKIAKDFLDQYTTIQTTITTGLEDITSTAERLENLLNEWYDTHSQDIADQLADALLTLSTQVTESLGAFTVQAADRAAEAMSSIPSDYTDLYRTAEDIKKILTQTNNAMGAELLYSPGSESLYGGADNITALYFITKGNGPLVIPKGSTIESIRFINSSTASHAVNLYLLEMIAVNQYKVVGKYSNLLIDNSQNLNIDIPTADSDLYMAIQQVNAYGLKYADNNQALDGGPALLYSGSAPAVDDVITPTQGSFYRSYNIEIKAVLSSRFIGSITAPGTFAINNQNLNMALNWHANTGFSDSTFTNGDTIENYQNKLTSSTFGDTSYPLMIKDNAGNPLYTIRAINSEAYPEAFTFLEFDKYGRYLRTLTQGAYDLNGFSADAYYVVMRKFTNYNTVYVIEPVTVSWLHSGREYTVGPNGDFTTFTAMLRSLKDDDTPKTVYVEEGVYDIYQEIGGAAFINSITNPGALNWRDVSDVVPPNTHIIGRGKVVLSFEPPASVIGSDAMAVLFSPLNVSGSCFIENIEITATNCRYAIHDETSNLPAFPYVERKYKNVIASKHKGSYGYDQCYAAGLAPNGIYEMDNCIFYNDQNWTFSFHSNNMSVNDKVVINIKDTIIGKHDEDYYHNTGCAGFGCTHTSPRNVRVNMNNCWLFGNIAVYAEGNMPNAEDCFAFKMIGCNAVTINTTVPTTKARIIKNAIAN